MMGNTARHRAAHPAYRSLRSRALLLGICVASGFVAAPAVAQATSRQAVTAQGSQLVARTARPLSSSICSAVSAASVSALVGYSVPAATSTTTHIAATKQSYGISAVNTTCTFGAQASIAALTKDVSLTLEVTSRPFTASEMQQAFQKVANATLKIKVTPYSGLGVPGVHVTETSASITGEGIYGLAGTRIFGATVFKTLSVSKLATLAKLAEKL
jgi:hypothetical protein